MNPVRWLLWFQENAAHQIGDGDMSGDRIGGDDFECICDEIEGLHYEWDHKRTTDEPRAAPPKTPEGA